METSQYLSFLPISVSNMTTKFEVASSEAESRAPSDKFRELFSKRVERAVEELVKGKIEEYFTAMVKSEELKQVAEHIFSMVLEGKDEGEISKTLHKLSRELAESHLSEK